MCAVSRRELEYSKINSVFFPNVLHPMDRFPPIGMVALSCYDIFRWCYLKSFKPNPNKECRPHFIFIALHTNKALENLLNVELDMSHNFY